ncbi:hypothetical protein [Corynebacterium cystitidis]|uniref:hypothetical protein n=1 Tax=Corynebacterium cystitidis TaxID=35757 RepID=UPI00211EC99F|nr:hypothetical protein [Corynebacterium cystitidis]
MTSDGGVVEQDTNEWLRAVAAVTKDLPGPYDALTLTGQMQNLIRYRGGRSGRATSNQRRVTLRRWQVHPEIVVATSIEPSALPQISQGLLGGTTTHKLGIPAGHTGLPGGGGDYGRDRRHACVNDGS